MYFNTVSTIGPTFHCLKIEGNVTIVSAFKSVFIKQHLTTLRIKMILSYKFVPCKWINEKLRSEIGKL